jgi:hypothetical protein
VREVRALPLDAGLPPGDYKLILRLERASDGLAIDAKTGLLGRQREAVAIGNLDVR